MSVVENLYEIKKQIPDNVRLIAVSKTYPIEDIQHVYDCGHKIFGENRAQEFFEKQAKLPADIEWHFIGHLQTNKVKFVVPFALYIHSIDSLKLLNEVNKEAVKNNKVVNCLLEIYIASEESKMGLDLTEVFKILSSPEFQQMQNVRICGVMGMATFTENTDLIRKEFQNLKAGFDSIKTNHFKNNPYFKEISMGMSGDFHIAIEEGSTMVRIGTAIFGKRFMI